MTVSDLTESTIGAVEARGTGVHGEVASLFWTVVSSRAVGTQRLAREVGVCSSWAGQWAGTAIWAVMSWWAKTSF